MLESHLPKQVVAMSACLRLVTILVFTVSQQAVGWGFPGEFTGRIAQHKQFPGVAKCDTSPECEFRRKNRSAARRTATCVPMAK